MLSSKIFNKLFPVVCGENITLDVVVKNQAETLGEFVQRVINSKGLTYRQVAARSGGEISHSYISKIVSGSAENLTASKLRALAKGIDEVEEKLFAVARGESTENGNDFEQSEIAALFYDYKNLSDGDQQELKAIWDMLKADIKRRKQKAGKT